jgi:hypothetical protein
MRAYVDICGASARCLLVGVATLAAAIGCNSSPVKLYPVQGKVFYKNQPADGAQVVFQSQEEAGSGESAAQQPMAYGTVGPDGSFSLRTEPYGDGAAAGDYKVLISWYAVDPRDEEGRISKLPAKYADPANPQLKATVKEGNNELEPFRLD